MSKSDHSRSPIDAVLLIAFGGPGAPEEIRPFLQNVARGRSISAERLEEVARHYEAMPGGRSPLTDLTRAQAAGLAAALAAAGRPIEVHVGMRNWHPYLHETLADLAARGIKRCLGVIMSPLRCEASWDRYEADVAAARSRTPGAPEVAIAPPWVARHGFVDAVLDRARHALEDVPAEGRRWTPLIFTAHSIPVSMAEGAPYVEEFTTAARTVARRLGHARWSLAYQSRSGRAEDRWLEPDVNEVLTSVASDGERHAVVVPLGFVCDHVEVLYDLDVEATATASGRGMTLHRARAVNDHPDFIRMLADLVLKTS